MLISNSFPSLRPRTQYYGMIQRSTIRFHCSYIYVHKYCRSWSWHRTSGSSHPIFFYASLFDSPKGIARAPDLYRLCTTSDSSSLLLQSDHVLYHIFVFRDNDLSAVAARLWLLALLLVFSQSFDYRSLWPQSVHKAKKLGSTVSLVPQSEHGSVQS